MGVDDALEAAGCKPGDEVRIVGRAFEYEGADTYEDEPEAEPETEEPQTDITDADGMLDASDASEASADLSRKR